LSSVRENVTNIIKFNNLYLICRCIAYPKCLFCLTLIIVINLFYSSDFTSISAIL
jgi:hypothetical protein